ETVVTMLLAAKYSFQFCWRNSKKETCVRIILAVCVTSLGYCAIQAQGYIINAVQKSAGKDLGVGLALIPFLTLVGIWIAGAILGRFNWFFRGRWNRILRFANQRELNDHRGRLDVARFRSKEYDDLQKRISELPNSWQTRIWFSEEI